MTASVDDLWIVDFGAPFPSEPAHHRPALVVGPPVHFGESFPIVIVCPLTTRSRGLLLHVEIEPTPENALDDICYVQCELIRSISRRRLVHRLGRVSLDVRRGVDEVVRTLLDH